MLLLHYKLRALFQQLVSRARRFRLCSQHLPALVVVIYLGLLVMHSLVKFQLRPSHRTLRKEPIILQTKSKPMPKKNANDDYDDLTAEEIALLGKSFKSADFDGDKLLSESEIEMAIVRLTKKHVQSAMRNNFRVFFSLDKDKKNGQVDWKEYYDHFLEEKLGLDNAIIEDIKKHPENMPRDIKESISRLRASWSEAARTDPDAVNIDEFLGLEHPESSHSMLVQRVEELLAKYDEDSDGKLSRQEYITDPYRDLSTAELEARGEEFDHLVDKDGNGEGDRREIIAFLDPKSQHWAKQDATDLVREGDRDGDGRISLVEMMENPDLFLYSKLVSPELNFHSEF